MIWLNKQPQFCHGLRRFISSMSVARQTEALFNLSALHYLIGWMEVDHERDGGGVWGPSSHYYSEVGQKIRVAENTGFSIILALSCSHTLIQIRDVTVRLVSNSLWCAGVYLSRTNTLDFSHSRSKYLCFKGKTIWINPLFFLSSK